MIVQARPGSDIQSMKLQIPEETSLLADADRTDSYDNDRGISEIFKTFSNISVAAPHSSYPSRRSPMDEASSTSSESPIEIVEEAV